MASSKFLILLPLFAATASAFAPSPGLFARAPSLRAGVSKAARSNDVLSLSMARKPFIAGNWKMNPTTVDEAKTLAKEIADASMTANAQVAICSPHPFLYSVGNIFKGSNVELGAQSVFFEDKGAFTGAVSTCMVKSIGVEHVLCGHSERRVIFKNDDRRINKKVRKVLNEGLKPMLCIGESKEEYEAKLNTAICANQLSKDLKGVTKAEMAQVTIAYEPVWAIGTGLTCDADAAQEVHAFVRSWLAQMYDQETADSVRILYGGSVTPDTVDDLMKRPDIDGCLVGGASLESAKFGRIMNFKGPKADALAAGGSGEGSGSKRAAVKDFFSNLLGGK